MSSENEHIEAKENFLSAKVELKRLLADPLFCVTARNRAFLKYAAKQHFSGNTAGATQYMIAVNVFGRPTTFKPESDPIVRIEACRLRGALDQYYSAFGKEGQIRVGLPRGHYATAFWRIKKTNPSPEIVSFELMDRYAFASEMDVEMDTEIYDAFLDVRKAVDKHAADLRALSQTLQQIDQAVSALYETVLRKRQNVLPQSKTARRSDGH